MIEASVLNTRTPVYKCKPVLKLLFIALLAELGYAVMNISTMPVYLKEDRNFGTSTIGLVFAAYLLCEAAFKSPMGHLADRLGPKRLMTIGPAISVCTAMISIWVPHTNASTMEVLTFVGLRALDGLGAAMLWPAAFAAVNEAVCDEDRQQAMSLLNLCYLLGIAIAFEFGGIANDLTGTKYAGLVMAACCFLAVSSTAYRFLPDVRPSVPVAGGHEASLADFIQSLKQIPQYLILAIIVFTGIGLPITIFKIFPADQFQFSETQIGSLICPGAIVMGIASIPMGRYGDRIGRERAVHLGLMLCTIGMSVIGSAAFLRYLRDPLASGARSDPGGHWVSLGDPGLDGQRQRHRPREAGVQSWRRHDRAGHRRYHRRAHRGGHVRKASARRNGASPGPGLRSLLPVPGLRHLCRVHRFGPSAEGLKRLILRCFAPGKTSLPMRNGGQWKPSAKSMAGPEAPFPAR